MPLGNVLLIALVPLQKLVLTKVQQSGVVLHDYAGIFGIGQINLRYLRGELLAAGVQVGQQALIDRHARFACRQRIAGVDPRNHRERVMVLGHHGRRHGEKNPVGVHQADLLPLAREGHRLPLHHRDVNLVREQAHYRGALDPGNLFKLPAPLAQGNEKDIAPDVFAEDRQHLSAADLGEPRGFDIACPLDAEAPVAAQPGFEKVG